jgi:hypothetical protein
MSNKTTNAQAELAREYAQALEEAHKQNEELKERIFEIDSAIYQLLALRKKLKAELG